MLFIRRTAAPFRPKYFGSRAIIFKRPSMANGGNGDGRGTVVMSIMD